MKKKVCQMVFKGLVTWALLLPLTGAVVLYQNDVSAEESSQYFQSESVSFDGVLLDKTIISGPPTPPPGITRMTLELPEPDEETGVKSLVVPAFNWSFGCTATSAAMISAYYDRGSYPNMYTGPTNGGVMPLNNSSWPDWVDGSGDIRHQCPLSATHQGLDGRATKGHVDDYWVEYNSAAPDPFIGNWTEHTHSDCTGDYMKTNQSNYGNTDGSTSIYYFNDGAPLYAADMETFNIQNYDGGYGFKLFVESRGYQVPTLYNQYIYGYNGNTQGFTFAQYKAQIDAANPVMIHVEGHTMVGVGYDDSSNTVYLNDTWDYSTHSMTWGGTYSGMTHLGVTVINLSGGETSSSTPWPLYIAAINSGILYQPPQPKWGAGSEVCCSNGSATFYLTSSGVTKKSTLADCYTAGTWEGWVTTTPGTKSFSWSLTGPYCGGPYTGSFNYTLVEGKTYYFNLEYEGGLVIYVYINSASSSGTGSFTTESKLSEMKTTREIQASLQRAGKIKLDIPKGAFDESSCKITN